MLTNIQDCAGSILYSTEKAIEVALEAMQCLGGNGYINGETISSTIELQADLDEIRIPDWPLPSRRATLRSGSGYSRNKAHVDWPRNQQCFLTLIHLNERDTRDS